MAGETSENSPAALKEASVELPAPDGWKKKFTPKKGGTPRRNVIVFISPTGEEITNKKQLDQYIRAHPEGPSSSEFDWGTGDTPRRSARLKAKPTESPEGEKPTKRERKSSGKKGKADKKDAEDGENEAIKAAEDAGAAGAQESADVEMKDAEGNAGKAEGEEVSKTVVEDGKEAEEGNQEKDVSMTLEGKEDENADKKMEDSEILIPTSEVKENENADKEKLEDSVALAQTQLIEKESESADKKAEDTDALLPAYEGKENEGTEKDGENRAVKTAEDAAASVEAQESTDLQMKDAGGNVEKAGEVDTEGNADEAEREFQKASVEKTNENGEQKTQGPQGNEISMPVVDRKEAEQANQEKEASEIVEGKEDENADKRMEDTEMLIPTSVEDRKEAEQANQEKEASEIVEGKEDDNADKKMEDAEMLIPTSEVGENENADNFVALAQTQHIEKENENAENKSEDWDVFLSASEGKEDEYTEKDGHKEDSKTAEDATAADEAQEYTDLEMKGTEGNADKAEEETTENSEQKTEGRQENESSRPVVEDGKEAENANQGKENEVANKMTEGSDILLTASEGKEEDKEKEKPEVLPQTQHAVSCNDGPHQPKSSPVNC